MSGDVRAPEVWDDDEWQDEAGSPDDSADAVPALEFGAARRSIEQLEEERLLKLALVDPFDELLD